MFEILTLNATNPTVGRPFRIEDLQNIWSAVAGILSVDVSTPKIVSGFSVVEAVLDPNAPVGDGVIAYDGALYVYDSVATPMKIGDTVILSRVQTDDVRAMADGTLQTFSFKNVAAPTGDGVAIGVLSFDIINQWKSAYVAPRSISGNQIGLRTVTRENLVQSLAPVLVGTATTVLSTNATLDDFVSWNGSGWEINDIKINGATTLLLNSVNFDLLPDTLTVRVNPADTATSLTTVSSMGVTQSVAVSSTRGMIMTLHKSAGSFVLASTMPFTRE